MQKPRKEALTRLRDEENDGEGGMMKAMYDSREEATEALGTSAVAQCDACECWCDPKYLTEVHGGNTERVPYEWVCPECLPQVEEECGEGLDEKMVRVVMEALQESELFMEDYDGAGFSTYRDVGMLTYNDGFVVRVKGREYQFTVNSRPS